MLRSYTLSTSSFSGAPKFVTCPHFGQEKCETLPKTLNIHVPRATRQNESRQTAWHARRGLASRGQLANQGISERRWTFCVIVLNDCLQRRTSADELEPRLLPARTPLAASASDPVTHLASLVALLVASISISIDCKPRRPFSLPPIILFCHVDVGSWACPGE